MLNHARDKRKENRSKFEMSSSKTFDKAKPFD